MSRDVEIKMARDQSGEQFYTRAHVDGLDGFEEYYQWQLDLQNSIYDIATSIRDSGWIEYQVGPPKNGLYATDGFSCGIREIVHQYGERGEKRITRKMIRVNIRNFTNGEQIAQLPTGFMKYTQVFYSRSGSGRQPIMVEIRGNGALNVYIDSSNQSGSSNSNWIYAQFEWTE
ncbi:hypothetical protein [Mammaliicoccus sciuri]|uniref:hypothetical protein n=1 Tax=Mammaliicoccus sciuri TaxID=1296 RepID=UPI0036DF1816